MYCTNCKKEIDESLKFCPYCGSAQSRFKENSATADAALSEVFVTDPAPDVTVSVSASPKKKKRRWLAILITVLAIIAALAVVTALHFMNIIELPFLSKYKLVSEQDIGNEQSYAPLTGAAVDADPDPDQATDIALSDTSTSEPEITVPVTSAGLDSVESVPIVNEFPIVTFNANGGVLASSESAIKQVTRGAIYGELPVPEREEYNFDGWYTMMSGGEQISAESVVQIEADATLFAHWAAKKEVWLADLSQYEWKGEENPFGRIIPRGNTFTDNHDVEHYDGAIGYSGWLPTLEISSATYQLNKEYVNFSGLAAIGQSHYDGTPVIRIYGDKELLWKSPKMTEGIRNVNFSIDVTDVNLLTIEYNGDPPDDHADIYILDAKFTQ